jgi:hypothetical protein
MEIWNFGMSGLFSLAQAHHIRRIRTMRRRRPPSGAELPKFLPCVAQETRIRSFRWWHGACVCLHFPYSGASLRFFFSEMKIVAKRKTQSRDWERRCRSLAHRFRFRVKVTRLSRVNYVWSRETFQPSRGLAPSWNPLSGVRVEFGSVD